MADQNKAIAEYSVAVERDYGCSRLEALRLMSEDVSSVALDVGIPKAAVRAWLEEQGLRRESRCDHGFLAGICVVGDCWARDSLEPVLVEEGTADELTPAAEAAVAQFGWALDGDSLANDLARLRALRALRQVVPGRAREEYENALNVAGDAR